MASFPLEYHSRRGDGDSPPELVPSSHSRLQSESYPGSIRTVAFGYHGQYVCSLSAGAAIPQLPPEEHPLIRSDFRLGPHEPMLYPQMWQHSAPHLAWIERHELHRDLHSRDVVAYVFQHHDWNAVATSIFYGRVSNDLLNRLELSFYEIYVKAFPYLKTARTRHLVPSAMITECLRLLSDLRVLTSTFRESAKMVTRVQRGIAELRAFRLFRIDVQYHVGDELFVSDRVFNYVGVFTSDQALANLLHRLGVPVFIVLRGLPRGCTAQPPIPWSRSVETKPLDHLDEYHTDIMGRRVRIRDASPPNLAPMDADDPRSVPRPRTSRRASRSPLRDTSRRTSRERNAQSTGSLSRRSQSPTRPSRRPRSPRPSQGQPAGNQIQEGDYPVSHYPRYILQEEARHQDSRTRRHPDAPARWRPRTWETDPGQQAAQGFRAPDWVPQLPSWLTDVAASVDRSVTREWRLCASDCISPVPQDVFTRPLEYALPPVHLLLKHEKRLNYVIASWAALRDFWFRRLIEEGYCGLSPSIWRKILDDKYNISSNLAEWIKRNSAATDTSTSSSRDARAEPSSSGNAPNGQLAGLRALVHDAQTAEAEESSQSTNRRYTRRAARGEDLLVATSRDNVEPEKWRESLSHMTIYYEFGPRRLIPMDEATFSETRSRGMRWDEYWDYEAMRVVLFDKSSRVPDEHPSERDCEVLVNEKVLAWYLSSSDEEGLAKPSRALWVATRGLVTDETGALTVFPGGRSAGQASRSADDRNVPRAPSASSSAGQLADGTGRGITSLKSHPDAPPPDPVYGYHPQLPNGQHAKVFAIRQRDLSTADLGRADVRAFMVWEIEEAEFRFQLRRADIHILRSINLWSPELEEQRSVLRMKVWGGADGFVPSGTSPPAHTDPDPRNRLASIYSFWTLIRAWPRCREVTNLAAYTKREGLSIEQLLQVERDVWRFYAQTFYDYFGILPMLPKCMPHNPFTQP